MCKQGQPGRSRVRGLRRSVWFMVSPASSAFRVRLQRARRDFTARLDRVLPNSTQNGATVFRPTRNQSCCPGCGLDFRAGERGQQRAGLPWLNLSCTGEQRPSSGKLVKTMFEALNSANGRRRVHRRERRWTRSSVTNAATEKGLEGHKRCATNPSEIKLG